MNTEVKQIQTTSVERGNKNLPVKKFAQTGLNFSKQIRGNSTDKKKSTVNLKKPETKIQEEEFNDTPIDIEEEIEKTIPQWYTKSHKSQVQPFQTRLKI